jgi:ABC-2 type transport system permease protein
MLVSTLARSSDVATGIAFIIWLGLLLFMDLILLGLLIRQGLPSETVIVLALFNPMQVFRTAAMMLFDPQLVLLGQSAYVILDNFGKQGYILWALLYPVGLGTVCAWFGYVMFKRSDLP